MHVQPFEAHWRFSSTGADVSPRRSRVRRRACSGPGAAETRINAIAAMRRKDLRICIVEDIVTMPEGQWELE